MATTKIYVLVAREIGTEDRDGYTYVGTDPHALIEDFLTEQRRVYEGEDIAAHYADLETLRATGEIRNWSLIRTAHEVEIPA